MFGLSISGSSFHSFNWSSTFVVKKSIYRRSHIRGEKTQRLQDSLKTKLKLSFFVTNGSCSPIYGQILWLYLFPVAKKKKNHTTRIAFENAHESSMTFLSLFGMSIFLPNHRLMRQISTFYLNVLFFFSHLPILLLSPWWGSRYCTDMIQNYIEITVRKVVWKHKIQ